MHTDTTTAPIEFQVGEVYTCRSACNSDVRWTYEVTKRTAKFVTLAEVATGEVVRCKVRVWDGAEAVSPHGTYSMSPVLRAA